MSDAGLDLRDELGLGAVTGEVGEGGAAVGRQGGGETLELLLKVSALYQIGLWEKRELTEQEGTAGRL